MEGNEKQKKTKKDNGTTGFVKVEVVKEFFQKQFGPFKGGHFFILGIVVIILIIGLALNKNSVNYKRCGCLWLEIYGLGMK